MIIAVFVIAAVVAMPAVAFVLVSVASRREDAAWSLGRPAQGWVQSAARRIVDFHSEEPCWPVPKNHGQVRREVPALPVAGGSEGSREVEPAKASIRTAA